MHARHHFISSLLILPSLWVGTILHFQFLILGCCNSVSSSLMWWDFAPRTTPPHSDKTFSLPFQFQLCIGMNLFLTIEPLFYVSFQITEVLPMSHHQPFSWHAHLLSQHLDSGTILLLSALHIRYPGQSPITSSENPTHFPKCLLPYSWSLYQSPYGSLTFQGKITKERSSPEKCASNLPT